MNNQYLRITLAALLLSLLAAPSTQAAQPDGKGKPVPNPDIVYMSGKDSTDALSQSAIRGVELSVDGLSGTDLSLQKSKAGRQSQAIAWSPDGKRAAWFEIGLGVASTPQSIMVAAPGSKGIVIYTSAPGDGNPQLNTGVDSLAWGWDCNSETSSVLIFSSHSPAGIFGIKFVDDQPGEPVPLMDMAVGSGLWFFPSAFALSPEGQYLAFAGSGSDNSSYGVWMLPLCTQDRTPFQILSRTEIGGSDLAPVRSMDWSRNGERLALSVTTGVDIAWRDLKIVDLSYLFASGVEQVTGQNGIWTIDLSGQFGEASSEHSPQWGPPDSPCQRLAFSQSDDVGRGMYLLDIGDNCDIDVPLLINSKGPRALDWK